METLKFNKKTSQPNKVRTNLLRIVDDETRLYIKSSSFKLNDRKPKDLFKQFDGITIKIDNPIISSYTPFTLGNHDHEIPIRESQTFDDNQNSTNYYLFKKLIQRNPTEFINLRKKNLGHKKLGLDVKISNSIEDSKEKSKSKKLQDSQNFLSGSFKKAKKTINEFEFFNEEEKLAMLIQNGFEKIQTVVKNLKKTGSPKIDLRNFKRSNSLMINRFNKELFEMLEWKGIKIDSHKLNLKEHKRHLSNVNLIQPIKEEVYEKKIIKKQNTYNLPKSAEKLNMAHDVAKLFQNNRYEGDKPSICKDLFNKKQANSNNRKLDTTRVSSSSVSPQKTQNNMHLGVNSYKYSLDKLNEESYVSDFSDEQFSPKSNINILQFFQKNSDVLGNDFNKDKDRDNDMDSEYKYLRPNDKRAEKTRTDTIFNLLKCSIESNPLEENNGFHGTLSKCSLNSKTSRSKSKSSISEISCEFDFHYD